LIGLVLKWSPRLRPDAIERHCEVVSKAGAVWWGRLSYAPGRAGLAAEWLQRLREQLQSRTDPTYVYLHSVTGGTWRARLLDATAERNDVDEALIPSYYDMAEHYNLWVKLTDFHRSLPKELIEGYVLARTGEPVSWKGLNNQTPLIVRRRDSRSGE
jgi:hypothetical protein